MQTTLRKSRACWAWQSTIAIPTLIVGSFAHPFGFDLAAAAALLSAPDPLSWISISNRWGATPVDQLQRLAESNGSAQYFLGWRYEFGGDLPKDPTEASKCYRAAAEQGFAPAQYLMGARAEHQPELQGQTIVGNFQVASEWYEKAAGQGYVPAMVSLGNLYFYGKLERDHKVAAKWFRLAAQAGNLEATLQLGELYRYNRGDLLQNHAESVRWFRIAAEKGSAEGQYQLALLLLGGEEIPHDLAEARQWLEKAAAQGHSKAIVKLSSLDGAGSHSLDRFSRQELQALALANTAPALLALAMDYEQGQKGPPDLYQAAGVYWHILSLNPMLDQGLATNIAQATHRLVGLYSTQKVEPRPAAAAAAQAGDGFPDYYTLVAPKSPSELARRFHSSQTVFDRPEDQLLLAEMFYAGKIVPEDWTEAVSWFLKAAKADNAEAINRIGELWAAGVDGAPDNQEAARWFRRAAAKGSLGAQLNLGRAYEKGDGLDQDLVQAWVWLKTASDRGAQAATAEMQQVQVRLTPEQLQRAKNSDRRQTVAPK